MISALLVISAAAPMAIPAPLRGIWDVPGQCGNNYAGPNRIVVGKATANFWQVSFKPSHVLNSDSAHWKATGIWANEDGASKGSLALSLSKDGEHLSVMNSDNRTVRLNRCAKK